LEKIPQDLLDKAYSVNFGRATTVKIQIDYNSKIVKKYILDKGITTRISANGFTEWWYTVKVDDTDILIEIIMT